MTEHLSQPDEARTRREQERSLFDGIADRYQETRQGYPEEIVDAMVSAAGLTTGSEVLGIGCGTGQLTRSLAGRGFRVLAIDLGAAMVDRARQTVTEPAVEFRVCSFEALPEIPRFGLVTCATAFHWLDPELAWSKAARLLRPNGWLALLSTGEQYQAPLGDAPRRLWEKYSRQRIDWSFRTPPWLGVVWDMPWFGVGVERVLRQPLKLPRESVIGVECTRATYLSYGPADQAGFASELRAVLEETPRVSLLQETFLSMAPRLDERSPAAPGGSG